MFISKKFIPSLFTILNAFSGFMSIVHSAEGSFDRAALYIIYATLFDMLDGMVARMLRSSSEFGVELDSLSDVVSFGVAPSFLLYSIYFKAFDGPGIAIASLIMIFSSIRLARFNVELVGYEKDKFYGIPTPVAAITICSYILIFHNKIFSSELSEVVIITLTIGLSLLMVSRFKYPVIPKITLVSLKKNYLVFSLLLAAVIVTIFTRGKAAFFLCLAYILSGIFVSIFNLFFRKKKPARIRK